MWETIKDLPAPLWGFLGAVVGALVMHLRDYFSRQGQFESNLMKLWEECKEHCDKCEKDLQETREILQETRQEVLTLTASNNTLISRVGVLEQKLHVGTN